MSTTIIILATTLGVLLYAAVAFYVAGVVERRWENGLNDDAVGFICGMFWPAAVPIGLGWMFVGNTLRGLHRYALTDPAERRAARAERKQHKAHRDDLAKARVVSGGGK